MKFLKIKTSFPFPFQKLISKVDYTEVKEASGIQYIILALINNNANKEEKFYDILRKFGVPNDLMFMFVDELKKMIDLDIIKVVKVNFLLELFKEYSISCFEFTDKGKMIFKDGSVPTGNELTKKINLYYEMLIDKIYEKNPIPLIPVQDDKIDIAKLEKYNFKNIDTIANFIQDNKNSFGFKEKEEVIRAIVDEMQLQMGKYEKCLELEIEDDEIVLNFSNSRMEDFVKLYYSGENISKELNGKSKFEFNKSLKLIKLEKLSEIKNVSNIFLPSQISTTPVEMPELLINFNADYEIKRKCNLSFSSNNEKINNISKGINHIVIINNEIKAYIPAIVSFKEVNLDKNLQLGIIIEKSLNEQEKIEFCEMLYYEINSQEMTTNGIKIIKIISGFGNFMERYIYDNVVNKDNIVIQVTNLNQIYKLIDEKETLQNVARKIYQKTIQYITLDNFKETKYLLWDIKDIIELDDETFLNGLISRLDKDEKLFNVIMQSGLSTELCLKIVNMLPTYMHKILNQEEIQGTNDLAILCQTLNERLMILKNLLGIRSITDYVIKDDYNLQDLIDNYVIFEKKLSELDKFAKYDLESSVVLHKYNDLIKPSYQYALLEKQTSNKSDKITYDFIESKIRKGDFKSAVADMVIKIDYDFSNMPELKDYKNLSLFDKIQKLTELNVISREDSNIYHQIRKFRNELLHPSNTSLNYDVNKLLMWNNFIFKKERV